MKVFISGENERYHAPIKAWVDGVKVEDKAFQQLVNTATLPFIHKHLAVMPDCHWGMGATIGTVLATKKAIVPAAVGVDIGCGMIAQRLPFITLDQVYEHRYDLQHAIEAAIPVGRTDNGGANDRGSWSETPAFGHTLWNGFLADEFELICEKHPRIGKWGDPLRHIGTLGTGNHFIEICSDENDDVWMMLHSGSRGIGNRVGTHFINLAKKECEKWHVKVPDANLSYLPEGTEYFDDYVQAVLWAQDYASANRKMMVAGVLGAIGKVIPDADVTSMNGVEAEVVDCHHNYVQRENHYGENVWVTRKGAVRARKGDLGIIPGSMGTRSYIVEGLGNPLSFNSCSHGAGRVMSRGDAKKTFTLEDHLKATDGVACRKDEGVLDETPGAYKNIDDVMAAQKDLVKIRHTLRAHVCVKG